MLQPPHKSFPPFSQHDSITPPTQPGLYWFQSDAAQREVMVTVCLVNAQLTVWWLNQDLPVANLKGRWRGPIHPFGERRH